MGGGVLRPLQISESRRDHTNDATETLGPNNTAINKTVLG